MRNLDKESTTDSPAGASARVDTRPEKLSAIAAALGAGLLLAALTLSVQVSCLALVPAVLAAAMIMLSALVAFFRSRMFRRKNEEWLAFEEYRAERTSEDIFESSDEATRLADRAERNFLRFAVPSITGVLGALLILLPLVIWKTWDQLLRYEQADDPLAGAVFSFSAAVAAVVLASYFVGVSREKLCRWVRPSGAWIAFSGLLFFLGGVVLLEEYLDWDIARLDVIIGKIGLALLIRLGLELLIKLIVDFYRPRRVKEEEKPLLESRLLTLLTEPGGIARNIADSLNYQFGFQVSESWLYRSLERLLVPFVVLAVLCMWLLSSVEVIEADENGVRERFGDVVRKEPMKPGLYLKLPWPFAQIKTFPVGKVRKLRIGYKPGTDQNAAWPQDIPKQLRGDLSARVIVWSQAHNKQEVDFLVPTGKEITAGPEELPGPETSVPVSVFFITANIPLYVKVDDLYSFLYRHEDSMDTLRKVAMGEVTRYLAHGNFFALLTEGRFEAARVIRGNIQQRARELKLGIEVVFVGLQGMHPPVNVGEDFDEVVAAMEKKHTKTLKAESYSLKMKPQAKARSVEIITDANIYKNQETRLAEAESRRFEKQLMAYRACPEVYGLYRFLRVMEKGVSETRRYVVAPRKASEVLIMDLKKKIRPDLLDVNLKGKEGQAPSPPTSGGG